MLDVAAGRSDEGVDAEGKSMALQFKVSFHVSSW
jgi:hypothetical protein